MLNGVPGKFARGCDDFCLVDQIESQLHRALAHRLADCDDIFG
jgi:hypothetical protein